MGQGGYKTVIYDCDGVMFDSFEANLEFYRRIMERFQMTLDRSDQETMRVLHTYSNRDVMEYLFADDSRKDEAVRYAGTIDYRDLVPMMRMEEGFRETLELLQPRVGLAVCTNRSTSMDLVLDTFQLSDYFGIVMTAARVGNPKPHPEPLFRVLEHYGIEPYEALFVGDSDVDRQAASAAGVPFVAYKSDLPSLFRIARHEELLNILRS